MRDPAGQPSADLVNRDFTATEPNRLWITDITEQPTGEGKLHCAAVMKRGGDGVRAAFTQTDRANLRKWFAGATLCFAELCQIRF